jgi:hypothetical protein
MHFMEFIMFIGFDGLCYGVIMFIRFDDLDGFDGLDLGTPWTSLMGFTSSVLKVLQMDLQVEYRKYGSIEGQRRIDAVPLILD